MGTPSQLNVIRKAVVLVSQDNPVFVMLNESHREEVE